MPPWIVGTGPDTGAEETRKFYASRRWYGAPMLATDGAAIALGVLAAWAADRSNAAAGVLAAPAIGLYLLGGPIVDALHGRGGHAAGMFLARVGLPAAGALLGGLLGFAQNGNNRRENGTVYDTIGGAAIGAGAGMLAAIMWDNLTAFEPVSTDPARVSLMPIATARTGALALRVSF